MSVIEMTRRPLQLSAKETLPRWSGRPARIEFKMQKQCHSNWCWAAVAASIAAYYGSNVKQCDIANVELHRDDCCNHPCDAANIVFNVTNVLASSLNRLSCFEQCSRFTRADPDRIDEELAVGQPLCARMVWRDGGGHFVVIVGSWSDVGGMRMLALEDPFWGPSECSYPGFADHYQLLGGRWIDTYYTKAPPGTGGPRSRTVA